MKTWFAFFIFLGSSLTAYGQKTTTVLDIDSLVSSERTKLKHYTKPIDIRNVDKRQYVFLSAADVRLNLIKNLKGIKGKNFTHTIALQDSFSHQTWLSTNRNDPTQKIELFKQSGSFNDSSVDRASGLLLRNKLCVQLVRITRSKKPYLVEIETCTAGPLNLIKLDKKECSFDWVYGYVDIDRAYALLDKNVTLTK